MTKVLIKNGRVIDPAGKLDSLVDILVQDGKIRKIGKNLKADGAEELDAKGFLVTPGLIDMHVHLREPGREDKETIETAMKAALSGGVTTVLAMPNTTPVADNQTVIEYQLSKARKLDLVNMYVAGAITRDGNRIADMREMKLTGAIAFSDDGHDVENPNLFYHALEWAKTFDVPILCHSEIESLTGEGAMHEGSVSLELGLPGISRLSEDLAVQRNVMLAKDTGARIHISHVATRRAVEIVRQAKKDKVRVTAEATPHHFSLTHEECRGYNTNAKMYPPLREEDDRNAVLKGLKDGTIDAIATDHAPHLQNEKYQPFVDAPKGTIGLETMFAAAMTYLVRTKALSLSKAIEKMTIAPARIMRVQRGRFLIGADADISVFDLEKKWLVEPKNFVSKGKNSVFSGKTLFGKAEHVMVGGQFKLRHGCLL